MMDLPINNVFTVDLELLTLRRILFPCLEATIKLQKLLLHHQLPEQLKKAPHLC